ncbi:SDR family NAD(P)-dependent oxidoreductase [Klebsiella pneumoniae subsp. pneumoniae]|nr:SDR family NAD(P)-dependent oxidoreductase [Klebsiella pneumoniae subsp. pneumoniae]
MSVMVITGRTAGAGKATALRFARAGYHVALIARDETGLQETRQACERFGIKTLAISADVVDAGALAALPPRWKPPSGQSTSGSTTP